MFLKRCDRRKGGRKHTYWVLVESYRTARGSRHRIVAYLGGLSRGEASGWAQLGRALSGKQRPRPEPSLFDPPHYDDPEDDEPVLVNLSRRFTPTGSTQGSTNCSLTRIRRKVSEGCAEAISLDEASRSRINSPARGA
jgi:hypothetical protein